MPTKLFSIDQKALLEDLKKIDPFVKAKSFIPFADHILIYSDDGETVYMSVLDIENILLIKLRGVREVEKPFKICIDNGFIKGLSPRECDICFELYDDVQLCYVKSPLGEITVPILPPNDFPKVKDQGDLLFEMHENELHEVITNILPYCNPEVMDSNNSFHIVYAEGTLRVGTRDNHSSCATNIIIDAPKEVNTMLSKKSMTMLLSLLSNESNSLIKVKEFKNDIIFNVFNGVLSCRKMIYGEMDKAIDFYRLSMPLASREGDIINVEDKATFLEQVQKAVIFTNEANKVLAIHLDRDKLTLELENHMIGKKSVQQVFVNFNHDGDTKVFYANANYLLKFIRSIPGSSFKINLPLVNGDGIDCIKDPMICDDDGYVRLLGALTT